MANVSFHRKTSANQRVTTEGAITFNTYDKKIYLGTGTSYYTFDCASNHSASTITSGMFPTVSPVTQTVGSIYANLWGQNKVTARAIIQAGLDYDGMDVEYCEGSYYNYCSALDGMPNLSSTYNAWNDYIDITFSKGFSYMQSIDVRLNLYDLVVTDYTSLKATSASYYQLPKDLPVHCIRTVSGSGSNTQFVGHFVIPITTSHGSHQGAFGMGTLTLFAEGTNAVTLKYCQIEDKSRSDKVRNEADTGFVYNYDYYMTTTVGINISSSGVLTPDDLYYEYWDSYTMPSYPALESRIMVVRCNVDT